ncbi:MAG: hypothetical protein V1907_00775 [Candidatus Kerfeldbacteria bacterium]
MRRHTEILIFILIAIAILVLIFIATAQQTARENVVRENTDVSKTLNVNSGLVPRTIPEKPTHATIPTGYDPHAVSVKFMDDLDLRIGPNGYPISRTGTELQSNEAASIMNTIKKAGGKWFAPSASIEQEKKIDDLRTEAEKSGREIADLNNYFTLTASATVDTTKWIDGLNALTEVEIASAAPLAQVLPSTNR